MRHEETGLKIIDVTPTSDENIIVPKYQKWLYFETAGNVEVILADDSTALFGVTAGLLLPLRVKAITHTTTSAKVFAIC